MSGTKSFVILETLPINGSVVRYLINNDHFSRLLFESVEHIFSGYFNF